MDERDETLTAAAWLRAVDGNDTIPPVPLDDLAHQIRSDGDLAELPALALLDEIQTLRAALALADFNLGYDRGNMPVRIGACQSEALTGLWILRRGACTHSDALPLDNVLAMALQIGCDRGRVKTLRRALAALTEGE
ncbi:MAG: hypothetical protein Q8Q14_04715 [Gemmatimonadales bacterium]|nr:hypothetical protein [Gemmatimonadales bacterium]